MKGFENKRLALISLVIKPQQWLVNGAIYLAIRLFTVKF